MVRATFEAPPDPDRVWCDGEATRSESLREPPGVAGFRAKFWLVIATTVMHILQ